MSNQRLADIIVTVVEEWERVQFGMCCADAIHQLGMAREEIEELKADWQRTIDLLNEERIQTDMTVTKLNAEILSLRSKAGIPDFAMLTPLTPNDVRVGQLIFLVDNTDDGKIHVRTISEVLRPHDEWKAYCANDGCRYGLDGVYIIGEA